MGSASARPFENEKNENKNLFLIAKKGLCKTVKLRKLRRGSNMISNITSWPPILHLNILSERNIFWNMGVVRGGGLNADNVKREVEE